LKLFAALMTKLFSRSLHLSRQRSIVSSSDFSGKPSETG
jgi:hypothetical protein